MSTHQSIGTLIYRKDLSVRLLVDTGIVDFYRSLIPKWIQYNNPRHYPHISVVRLESPSLKNWKLYHGHRVSFTYDTSIHIDNLYIWMNVYSDFLLSVRRSLGLSGFSRHKNPPKDCFHITIANRKRLR